IESCTRLSDLARPDHVVLGGHKLPFTGLPWRLRHLIDNHHSALDRLMAHLHSPHSAGDCFSPLFRRPIGDGEYGLALVEAIAHLNHLYLAGRVTRQVGPDGVWLFQAAAQDRGDVVPTSG
ncbi:MAG: MBL fold metallo-hydrolase, partial [Paracoccaceae bacterium]